MKTQPTLQTLKTPSRKLLRVASTVAAAALAMAPWASAQTPTALGLRLYAGLTVTGAIGTVYSVEFVTDLAQTNSWRCLEFLQLPASPHLWADKSAPATGQRFYRAVPTGAPTNMVFIPPGTFRMGSPTNEVDRSDWEGPQTAVTISRGFWMAKYEVTQEEYLTVMGYNPSWFKGVRDGWDAGCGCYTNRDFGVDLNRPVEMVTWFDARNYCAALTQRQREAGRIATNCVYRLPTEAEWEYACRAGTSDRRFSYGDDPAYSSLTNYAWYSDNSGFMTHPVGQKLPNPWGLHDMHGNVMEWCRDGWADRLPGGIAVDPQGPAPSLHVIRGSSWGNLAGQCRSAFRYDGDNPSYPYPDFGFRVVLAPDQP